MRKLKLHLDDLRVETFAAGAGEPEPGTVRANMPFKIDVSDDACGGGGGGGGGSYWDCTTPKTCWNTCGIDYCTDMTCFASMCNDTYCCP
jgi:hypothetical protein